MPSVNDEADGAALLLGFAFLPRIILEPALDQNGLTLLEILGDVLGMLLPRRAVNETGFVYALALRGSVTVVDGEAQAADGGTSTGVSQVGVFRESAKEDDFVHV